MLKKTKIAIGAAIVGAVGVGIERGLRDKPSDTPTEQSSQAVEKNKAKEGRNFSVEPDLEPTEGRERRADTQKRNDEEEVKRVKKFIDKIYELEDDPAASFEDRHGKMSRYLEERIGEEFVIGEFHSFVDADGESFNLFKVYEKDDKVFRDDVEGQAISIIFRGDGSVGVECDSPFSFDNFQSNAQLGNNVVNEIHKIANLRRGYNSERIEKMIK